MKRVTVTEIAFVVIGLGIGWLLIGQALQGRLTLANIWTDLSTNAGTEAIGIAITVLVIDRLYERRDQEREKQRIIRQMASPSNDFALEAVRLAGENGWLTDGSLHRADLIKADLRGADLIHADLRGANLIKADLRGANLSGATLSGATLSQAYLNGAKLVRANLSGATLIQADLSYTKLVRAKLVRADLSRADLSEADLSKAKYDDNTKWPDGFDPVAAGAILVTESNETQP